MGLEDRDVERLLKVVYDDSPAITEPLFKISKLYAMISKKRGGGLEHDVPYKIAESRGVGGDFAKLYSRVTNGNYGTKYVNMRLDFDKFFGMWSLPIGQKLRVTKKGRTAYLNLVMREANSLYHSMSLIRAISLVRDGTLYVAEISDVNTTNKTFKLKEKTNIRGMLGARGLRFQLSTDKLTSRKTGDSGTPVAEYVTTSLNEDTGLVGYDKVATATGTVAQTPDPADGNFIHYPDSINPSYSGFVSAQRQGRTPYAMGLDTITPPSADLLPNSAKRFLFNLDRSINPGRLAGTRYTRSGLATETGLTLDADKPHEAILAALGQMSFRGAKFKYGLMNTPTYIKMVLGLKEGVRYNKVEAKGSDQAKVGFQAVNFVTGGQGCKILSEDTIYNDVVHCLNFRDLVLCTLTKKAISMWKHDGETISRVPGQDMIYSAAESRLYLRPLRMKNFARITV